MSIIDAYDESNEIVKAEIFTKDMERLPETAIVVFKKELIDYIEDSDDFEEYSYTLVAGDKIKLYKAKQCNKDVIIYRTLVGAPATVSIMEELIPRGVKNFIIFGSCGQLTSNVPKGTFIIPTDAYRDEGTSYHYMPSSDFVNVDSADILSEFFKENEIKFYKTKAWTTDALYRETINKAKIVANLGCDVVEMECASIMAMAKHRNIKAYQFLYCDDTLESEEWDLRTMQDDRCPLLIKCLDISLKLAEKI